jgi:hypothetical protein
MCLVGRSGRRGRGPRRGRVVVVGSNLSVFLEHYFLGLREGCT